MGDCPGAVLSAFPMSYARASPEVNPRVLTEVSKLTPPEGESNQCRDRGTDPSGTGEVEGNKRFDVARSERQVVVDVELGRPRFRGGVRQAVEIQLERHWEISQPMVGEGRLLP